MVGIKTHCHIPTQNGTPHARWKARAILSLSHDKDGQLDGFGFLGMPCSIEILSHSLHNSTEENELAKFSCIDCVMMEGTHHHPSHLAQVQEEEGHTSSSVEEAEMPLQNFPQLVTSESTRSHVTPMWTVNEMLVLVREKWAAEHEILCSTCSIQSSGDSDKWHIVSNRCKTSKVLRTASQCRKKWEALFSEYKKIKNWVFRCQTQPYRNMSHNAKKQHKLPFYMEQELFDAMDAHLGKRPSRSPEAMFDSMDVGTDDLFTSEDDLQDDMSEMQYLTLSGNCPERLDSTGRKKRGRSPATKDDIEHGIATAIRQNSKSIQAILHEATQARIRSTQLEREIYWRGVEMNRELELQIGGLDRELRRKQSEDLVEVLGGLVNAINHLVDAMQTNGPQQTNTQ